ncbi:MAG: hypothetical protein ACOCWQ_03435 [Nanoarchaeota archaeon]
MIQVRNPAYRFATATIIALASYAAGYCTGLFAPRSYEQPAQQIHEPSIYCYDTVMHDLWTSKFPPVDMMGFESPTPEWRIEELKSRGYEDEATAYRVLDDLMSQKVAE